MRACALFPYNLIRNVEIFYLEFDFGCVHESQKHLEGMEEYVFMLRGKLNLTIGDKKLTVQKKAGRALPR